MFLAVLLMSQMSCPDPQRLDAEVDAKLLRLHAGMSVSDMAQVAGMDEQELHVQLASGELHLHVGFSDRGRTTSVGLICQIDGGQRLTSCKPDYPRSQIQVIDRRDFAARRVGEPIGSVLAAVCAPEGIVLLPDGEFELTYHLDTSREAYLPLAPAVLRFGRDGRLKSKREGGSTTSEVPQNKENVRPGHGVRPAKAGAVSGNEAEGVPCAWTARRPGGRLKMAVGRSAEDRLERLTS
jgi:hypothetical protein